MTPKSDALPRRVVLRWALVALVVSGSSVSGQEPEGGRKKPVVLVPPFENQSKHHEMVSYEVATGSKADQPKRRFIIDRLTEAPRSVLEDMLGKIDGITIVERQRVDALLVEAEFGGLSGLVDPEKAVKLGKMLGANVIIMGTLIDIHDDVVEFEGFGIKTKNTKVVSQIRLRLLDIETGKVRFSKIVKGSQTYSKSSFGGKSSSDRNFAAVQAALEQLQDDSEFQAAMLGRKQGSSRDNAADGLVEVELRQTGKLRHRDRRQVCRRVTAEASAVGRERVQSPDRQGRVQGLGGSDRAREGPAHHTRARSEPLIRGAEREEFVSRWPAT